MVSEMDSTDFGQSWKLDYSVKGRTIKQETPWMGFTV